MLSKIVAIHTLWPLKLSLQACFNTERFFFFKYYFHNIVIISLEEKNKVNLCSFRHRKDLHV